ncbi:MAG: hypothetical protein ACHP7O_06415, partial [Burkholderiales bacterium]
FHLKWVAKIALCVGVVACVGLLPAVFLIADMRSADYARIIFDNNLVRQGLGPAILVFGLWMVVIASVSTWVIALYSSFRIAGPLFKFSQNLKWIIEHAFTIPVTIRRTDMLQREWREFDASQAKLREHYRSLREALDRCEQLLQTDDEVDTVALRAALAQLQEIERRAQL